MKQTNIETWNFASLWSLNISKMIFNNYIFNVDPFSYENWADSLHLAYINVKFKLKKPESGKFDVNEKLAHVKKELRKLRFAKNNTKSQQRVYMDKMLECKDTLMEVYEYVTKLMDNNQLSVPKQSKRLGIEELRRNL